MNDLVAGHVQSGFTTLATASSVLDRVRTLAIASETRLATRPNIPTFKEGGIDLVVEHWWGVLAPAGLPPEIAARLTARPQSHSRLARVRDAPRAARRHGVPCLARAVPRPDRERHGALGRYRQVGRDQRPVTDAASTGRPSLAAGHSQRPADVGGFPGAVRPGRPPRRLGKRSRGADFRPAAARGGAGRKRSRRSGGLSGLAVPDGAADQCDDWRVVPMHAASRHGIDGGRGRGSARSRPGPA